MPKGETFGKAPSGKAKVKSEKAEEKLPHFAFYLFPYRGVKRSDLQARLHQVVQANDPGYLSVAIEYRKHRYL